MKSYTGAEYLMIDAATQFGLSKVTFEERIEWTKANLANLENLLPDAKEKPLYLKAVYAIRDAQSGKPTGHLVGLDASSSGLQIMSAAMGCYAGAEATGLINPDEMPWAYKRCTDIMQEMVGQEIKAEMDDVKQAVMTYFYGSEAKPKEIFGEGTVAYQAFFEAAKTLAPEAYDLRNILIGIWQPFALEHSWTMPDGFEVVIRVMEKKEVVVKVPELNSSFTHIYYENAGTEKGLSLAANVVHSIDGMIVREMNRRCNYDKDAVIKALQIIASDTRPRPALHTIDKTEMVLMAHMDLVTHTSNVQNLSVEFLARMEALLNDVLASEPFELVCVHDEFKAHANNMDTVRYWYTNLLAELADSHIMQNIIRQITKDPSVVLQRASEDLSQHILKSNYALG